MLLASAFPAAFATATPDGPLSPADRTALFERLRSRQAGIRAFRATVTQKKRSPLLLAEGVTEGRILFGRPDRFRWESDKPERRIVVADGTTLTVYDPVRKEAERHDQRDQFAARMAVEFMTTGMGGSLADLEKRFRVEAERRGREVVLTLTPKARWLLRAVKSITIRQPDEGAVPAGIVVLGARGDRTETLLSDVVLNSAIPADAFLLKLPPGVRLFDAKQRAERGEDAP